ncbi:hypothetical protein SASPL_105013 [Salvia splendens]|uniref:Uncharacterized protein n=1 Tax=Salvia splendens TaxID=180675 RepID=A0A8X8YKB4_SALSN|nr:hypothetical protein SASPL_105013 [Salvia splendens]
MFFPCISHSAFYCTLGKRGVLVDISLLFWGSFASQTLVACSILAVLSWARLASDAVPAAIPCRTRSRYCHRRRTLTAAGSLSAASLFPSLCSARHRAVGWRWSPLPFHSSLPALVIAVATAEESARLPSWLSRCRRSWGSPSA